MNYYSQFQQDEWLYNHFYKNKIDGVFLEIGADDGIDKSNTKFFEDLGWSGLCIEPSPNRFSKLVNNRKCICENIAIFDKKGEIDFLDISGWGKGLSGIVESYDEQHVRRIAWELENPENKGHNTIKVNTDTLNNILEKYEIYNIDFCTIDTEGSEYEILKDFDFDRFNIDIIIVENNYGSNNVKDLLESKGYEHISKIEIDDVYKKIK
jgi:FkbM family methyltransferase